MNGGQFSYNCSAIWTFEQTSNMLRSFSSIFFFFFRKLLLYIKKKGQYRKVLIMCWLAGLTLLLLSIFSWNPEKSVTKWVFFKVSQTCCCGLTFSKTLFVCSFIFFNFFFYQRALLNAMADTHEKKLNEKWKQQASGNSMPHIQERNSNIKQWDLWCREEVSCWVWIWHRERRERDKEKELEIASH